MKPYPGQSASGFVRTYGISCDDVGIQVDQFIAENPDDAGQDVRNEKVLMNQNSITLQLSECK